MTLSASRGTACSITCTTIRRCSEFWRESRSSADPCSRDSSGIEDLESSPFSPVRFAEELSRKMVVFREKGRRDFSAVQTAWRMERDSNPRYSFPYVGFQDVRFSPPSLVFKHLQWG